MWAFHHHGGSVVEQCDEMLDGIASGVPDILERFLAVQSVPLGNLDDALRPEGALGVDVDHLSVASAFFLRQLGGYTEGVCELCFACPKFPKGLGNGHGFNSSS
jgi:hypothetical protein